MTVFFVSVISLMVFLVGFWIAGVVPSARRALGIAASAIAIMRDATLDDREKEKAVQQSALALLAGFVSILLRSAAALLISLLPIWLAELAGLVPMVQVFAYLQQWHVMATLSLLVTIAWLIAHKIKQSG